MTLFVEIDSILTKYPKYETKYNYILVCMDVYIYMHNTHICVFSCLTVRISIAVIKPWQKEKWLFF